MENNYNNRNYTALLTEATERQLETYNSWHALRLLHVNGGLTKKGLSISLETKLEDERHKGTVRNGSRAKWVIFSEPTYELSGYGANELRREELKLMRAHNDAKHNPSELESIARQHGLDPTDFHMQKLILVDGAFDHAAYGTIRRPTKSAETRYEPRSTSEPARSTRSNLAESRRSESSRESGYDTVFDTPSESPTRSFFSFGGGDSGGAGASSSWGCDSSSSSSSHSSGCDSSHSSCSSSSCSSSSCGSSCGGGD